MHLEMPVYRHAMTAALLTALLLPATIATADVDRWFTPQQAVAGEPLYTRHCASCHGTEAQGTADWRRPGADGRYSPPPLDGSGHAWHHPLPLLGRIIAHGSPGGNGNMPAWKAVLSDAEIDTILAWLQSRWPERVYAAWRDIDARAARR